MLEESIFKAFQSMTKGNLFLLIWLLSIRKNNQLEKCAIWI